jgi:hypothetical protein
MPRGFASSRERRQLLGEHARWRGLGWILSWLGVVCLLLSLGLEASAHHPPQVVCYRSMRRSTILLSRSSYQLMRRASTQFIHCRNGPRQSFFAPNFFLPVDDVDSWEPPWLDYGGPPGTSWGPRVNCKAAGHPGSTQQEVERASFPKFSEIPARQPLKLKTRSFVPAFS